MASEANQNASTTSIPSTISSASAFWVIRGPKFVRQCLQKSGFRMKEIPIVFVDRAAGTSKMSRRIVWEAVFLVWKLRIDSILNRFWGRGK